MVIIKCLHQHQHQHQYKSSTTTLPTTIITPPFQDPRNSTMIEEIDEIDLNGSDIS
jgi:hypothetical protein